MRIELVLEILQRKKLNEPKFYQKENSKRDIIHFNGSVLPVLDEGLS